ncbi:MAG: DUF1848 domain-containing protein, partial [Bacteroidota bacterium]|nr:DUF1848 domain-containing protein [Bacteroidota bacterium]
MAWPKVTVKLSGGETVEGIAPVIISASRSTDIPAFYPEWLVQRLKEGYVRWRNPFNGSYQNVFFDQARLIVFWSKNPRPVFPFLDEIAEKIPNYYFQFTLNDYEKEKLEPFVPGLQSRRDTFMELSKKIGKEKVIWRFDPLVLTEQTGVEELLRKVEKIGNQLKGYTEKLVFSFADINRYKKVQKNLQVNRIPYREFTEKDMAEFACGLQQLNKSWDFELATCAEKIDLEQFGILHNKCIDDDLMIRLFPYDKKLMDFLGVTAGDLFNSSSHLLKSRNIKDKGQRKYCRCVQSKDIGSYNTCPHSCLYCYAN